MDRLSQPTAYYTDTASAVSDERPAIPPFLETPVNYLFKLSTCRSYNTPATTQVDYTFEELIEQFSVENVPITPIKEGPGFLIGPCEGRRSNANLRYATAVVIDADKRYTETGELTPGAPDPQQIHAILASNNISHILYTTHSHGSGVGDRYRIVFPVVCSNKHELAGAVTYLSDLIRASCPSFALSSESLVWAQLWALPRRSSKSAPYLLLHHRGYSPNAVYMGRHYEFLDEAGQPVTTNAPPLIRDRIEATRKAGVIGLFNHYHPIDEVLDSYGYEFVMETASIGPEGAPQLVRRYRPSGSRSQPGVVVLETEGLLCVYSHHDSDPLNNGHMNDSFEAFRLLNGLEFDEALQEAIVLIQLAIANELNKERPSIMENSQRFKIGNATIDELGGITYRMMDWSSFTMEYANRPGVPAFVTDQDGNESIRFIDLPTFWKKNENRIMYNGLIYKPSPVMGAPAQPYYEAAHDRPYFNTFSGWPIVPMKGKWPLLDWHLRYAICGGVEEEYTYLLNWFAHLVQFPTSKPRVAVVLRGGKGWGKSLLFQAIHRALGPNSVILSNNTQLTGRFNAHLRYKLLAVVEESFWAGHHRDEGVLKNLITDPYLTYEAKGIDPVAGLSYLRVAMITNEDWAAPASGDERRYFVPTLTNVSYQEDIRDGKKGHFFPRLIGELAGAGLAAFFWDMAHRAITVDCLATVPDTPGLKAQRALSLKGLDAWLYRCLADGEIRLSPVETYPWNEHGCVIPDSRLREAAHLSVSVHDKERNTSYKLETLLGAALGGCMSQERSFRRFSGLTLCRREFVRYAKLAPNVFDGVGQS